MNCSRVAVLNYLKFRDVSSAYPVMKEYYGRDFIPYDAGSFHPGFDDEQHPLMRAFYLILLLAFAIFMLATVYYRDDYCKEKKIPDGTIGRDREFLLNKETRTGSLYPKHSAKVKPSVRRRSTVVELPRYKRRMMKEKKQNTLQVPNLIRVSERLNLRRRGENSKATLDAGEAPKSDKSTMSAVVPHRDTHDTSSSQIRWTDHAEPHPVAETESASETKESGLDDVATRSDVKIDEAVDLPSTLEPELLVEPIGPSTQKEKGREEVGDERNNEILAPTPEETVESTVGPVDEQKDNAEATSDSGNVDSKLSISTNNKALSEEPNVGFGSNQLIESTPLEPFPNLVESDTYIRRSTPTYRSARIAKLLGRGFNPPEVHSPEDVRATAWEREDPGPSGNIVGKDVDDPFTDQGPTDIAENLFSSLQKKPTDQKNAIPEAGIETNEEKPSSSSAMDERRGKARSRESRDLDSSPTRSRHRKGLSHSSQLADALLKRSRVPRALKTPDWNPVAAQNSEDSRPTSPKTTAARRKSSYSHFFSEEPRNPRTPRRSSFAPPIQEEPTSPLLARIPRNSTYAMVSSDEVPINSPSAPAISMPWTLRKMSIINGSRPQTPMGTQSRRASEMWETQPGRRASVNIVQSRVLESLPSSPREIFQSTTSDAALSDISRVPGLPSSSSRGSAAVNGGVEDSQENPTSGQVGDASPRPRRARRQTETSTSVAENSDQIERSKSSG